MIIKKEDLKNATQQTLSENEQVSKGVDMCCLCYAAVLHVTSSMPASNGLSSHS